MEQELDLCQFFACYDTNSIPCTEMVQYLRSTHTQSAECVVDSLAENYLEFVITGHPSCPTFLMPVTNFHAVDGCTTLTVCRRRERLGRQPVQCLKKHANSKMATRRSCAHMLRKLLCCARSLT